MLPCGTRGFFRKLKKIKILLKILLCIILISILFRKLDFADLHNVLENSSLLLFLPAFLLLFINTLISTLKWRILLKADGLKIKYSFLLQSYMVGTFMNMFLPSSVGGDIVRIADIA